MVDFAIRNLLLFFKDRAALLLSFLAEFIVVGLYILFIRQNLVESFSGVKDVELLMDLWMIAGILGITSVTTTMGAYGIMVEDKGKRIRKDFTTSPTGKVYLLLGYFLGAVIIALVLSVMLFLLARLYLLHGYGVKLETGIVAAVYGTLLFTTLSNAAMVLLLVSFVKSSNALASCCTILGSLIGFLTGIYLPVGALPQKVQWLIKCFPVSHNVALFRELLLDSFWQESFGGEKTPPARQFIEYMGVQYWTGERFVSAKESILFIGCVAGIFMLITIIKEKTDE